MGGKLGGSNDVLAHANAMASIDGRVCRVEIRGIAGFRWLV